MNTWRGRIKIEIKELLIEIQNTQTKTYLLRTFLNVDVNMYIYYDEIRNCLEFGKNKDD